MGLPRRAEMGPEMGPGTAMASAPQWPGLAMATGSGQQWLGPVTGPVTGLVTGLELGMALARGLELRSVAVLDAGSVPARRVPELVPKSWGSLSGSLPSVKRSAMPSQTPRPPIRGS